MRLSQPVRTDTRLRDGGDPSQSRTTSYGCSVYLASMAMDWLLSRSVRSVWEALPLPSWTGTVYSKPNISGVRQFEAESRDEVRQLLLQGSTGRPEAEPWNGTARPDRYCCKPARVTDSPKRVVACT